MQKPALARTERSQTADFVTVIVMGALAAVVIASTVTGRLLAMFRDAGFAWSVPIDQMPVDATVGSGAASVEGIASEVLVMVPDIDPMTAAFGAASAVLWGVTALVVVTVAIFLARSFMKGRFFHRSTARAFDIAGWAIVIGGLIVIACEGQTLSNVLSAVGADGRAVPKFDFWAFAPVWAVGVSMGLLGIAFRRGIRLQEDAEGLV